MIFDSISKNIKLKKISKILGAPFSISSVQGMMNRSEKKDKAIDDLYFLAKNYKYTNKRLKKYNVDSKRFKEIYRKLILTGAGQWVRGHYVAASSLVFGSTLEYILEKLEKLDDADWDTFTVFSKIPDYWRDIAFSLIEYFEKGKTGKVE